MQVLLFRRFFMAMFGSFDELVNNGQFTENTGSSSMTVFNPAPQPVTNLDLVIPPTPPPPNDNNPPKIPQWGRTLIGRVAKIEQTMATRTEMQQGFAQIDQRLAKIEQYVQK